MQTSGGGPAAAAIGPLPPGVRLGTVSRGVVVVGSAGRPGMGREGACLESLDPSWSCPSPCSWIQPGPCDPNRTLLTTLARPIGSCPSSTRPCPSSARLLHAGDDGAMPTDQERRPLLLLDIRIDLRGRVSRVACTPPAAAATAEPLAIGPPALACCCRCVHWPSTDIMPGMVIVIMVIEVRHCCCWALLLEEAGQGCCSSCLPLLVGTWCCCCCCTKLLVVVCCRCRCCTLHLLEVCRCVTPWLPLGRLLEAAWGGADMTWRPPGFGHIL